MKMRRTDNGMKEINETKDSSCDHRTFLKSPPFTSAELSSLQGTLSLLSELDVKNPLLTLFGGGDYGKPLSTRIRVDV